MALRIIHTADWHLGQMFYGYDREEEHDAFLLWLSDVIEEQKTDILLIAGDVFDVPNPSAASQRRFYHFLREVNRRNPFLQIIVVAGNHDSATRLEAPVPLLEELNTTVIGVVQRTQDGQIDFDRLLVPLYNSEKKREGWCLAVPFLRQGDYPPPENLPDTYVKGICRMYQELFSYANQLCSEEEAIVAMGHLHATGAELSADDRSERVIMGGLESVSTEAFHEDIVYTALGHIHKAQRVGGKDCIRYAGSPLPMSFSEINYRHQVIHLEIEKGKVHSITPIPIPRTVELMRIPEKPVPPEEVLEKLILLPDKTDGDTLLYPYLEVQVFLTEPEPGFRHKVEEIIASKAVRLASIVTSYQQGGKIENMSMSDYNDLQKINPTEILKHAFSSKYGGDLPEEIEELFMDVLREVEV